MALGITTQSADIVHCELHDLSGGNDPRRPPVNLTLECPEIHAGLQDQADAVLALVELPTRRLRQYSAYMIADQIAFRRTEGIWEALPGQWLVQTEILFPPRAAEYGATHMLCSFAAQPDATGSLNNPRPICLSDTSRAVSIQERALRRTLADWRLTPSPVDYCMDEQIYVHAAIIFAGQLQPSTQMPDPADLPDLCRQDDL